MKKTQAQKQMELLAALEKSSQQTIQERGDNGDNEVFDPFAEPQQQAPSKQKNYESYGVREVDEKKDENPPPEKKKLQIMKKTNTKKKGDDDVQFFDVMGGNVSDQQEEHHIEVTLVKEGQVFHQQSNPFQQQAHHRVHDPLRDDIDDQIEHDPFSVKSSDQINNGIKVKQPETQEQKPDSMANYQAGLSQKAALRKKQIQKEEREKEREKESSTSHIDNLLAKVGNKGGAHKAIHNQIFDDELGEVGEWVGKSAAVNKQDSDAEEEDDNKDDEFDAVFEEPSEQQKKEGLTKPKSGQTQELKSNATQDTSEGSSNTSEIKQEKVNLNANYRVVKKKGQFANSLAEKARAIAENKEIQQMKEKSAQEQANEVKNKENAQSTELKPLEKEKPSEVEEKKTEVKPETKQANKISKEKDVIKNKPEIVEDDEEEAKENFHSVDLGEGSDAGIKIQLAENDDEEEKITTVVAQSDKKETRQPARQMPKKQLKSLGKKNIATTGKATEQTSNQSAAQDERLVVVQKQEQKQGSQQKVVPEKSTTKEKQKEQSNILFLTATNLLIHYYHYIATEKDDEQDLEAKPLEAMNDEDWEEISKKNLQKMKQKKASENNKSIHSCIPLIYSFHFH